MKGASDESCPSKWHLFGAWKPGHGGDASGAVTYIKCWKRTVAVDYADALTVHGDPFDADLECPTLDQVRRMIDDRQASKRHPAIKPNRRRSHR